MPYSGKDCLVGATGEKDKSELICVHDALWALNMDIGNCKVKNIYRY